MHRRSIGVDGNALKVSDTISGRGIHRAAGHFHFHPDVRLEETAAGEWAIFLPQGNRLRMVGRNGLRLKREEGKYAPEFGKSVSRPVLVWRIEGLLPISAAVDIFEKQR